MVSDSIEGCENVTTRKVKEDTKREKEEVIAFKENKKPKVETLLKQTFFPSLRTI